MKKVLIYAGTTEGRVLSEELAKRGISSEVRVATEYGRQVMQDAEDTELITVRQGRLLPEEMRELLLQGDYLAVVDATHPHATAVTKNVKESVQGSGVPYFRLARELEEAPGLMEESMVYANARDCALALQKTEGIILLTTGSKELAEFCAFEDLKKRLVVRVLPGRESMEICWKLGLEGKQIIAMQGPFTKEMNLACIRQWNVTDLVTKESGKVGGTDEKLEAAKEAGIRRHVIKRPVSEEAGARSFEEVLAGIEKLAEEAKVGAVSEKEKKATFDVVLAGIGMGARECQTVALQKRLEETDYLFGAKRMIEGLTAKAECFPFYLERDIIPCLERISEGREGEQKVTILFSGDTGFYSGARKMLKALRDRGDCRVSILPGISSLSATAAKFGMDWQDVMILSTHGSAADVWKSEALFGLRQGRTIYFITSGPEDVRELSALATKHGFDRVYRMKLGYQLSYREEKLYDLSVTEAGSIEKAGLYAGFFVPTGEKAEPTGHIDGRIAPGYCDEVFLRDKVPMTKEEIREISICKLHLTKDAVVYDVGSGTGSISMEIAALSPKIRVFAIETNPDAVALQKNNQERFGAYNVTIVEGMAPQALESLPTPTHVFIGGSKGNLKGILDEIVKKNPSARVVMNAISLESISQMTTLLCEYPVEDLEITNVSVSKAKKVGEYHLMQAANPVTIFSFTLAGPCEIKTEG